MADKKSGKPGKFETDDWDIDNDLDMPDFDFDAKSPADDRKPSTKIATNFAQGARDSVLNTGFLRSQIKNNLPKGYGQGLDLVDQSAATLRNLYNTSAKELKPMVNDLKRTTKRIMPAASKFMPKTAADMINRWADDTKKNGQLSAEEVREAGINTQLGEIFQYQQQQEGKQQAESEAKAGIQEQIANTRHRDQLGQLDAIRIQTSALVQYQNRITSQWQRKSLELQYRHYFVAMDSLEEQKKTNVTTAEHLANIAKNTALPEYVKITQSERAMEMLRNRFMGGMADSVFDKRRGFLKDFQKNLVKNVQTKVRDFGDSVRNGLSMADSVMDLQDMQNEMGGGPSPGELAGNLAGNVVGENLGNRVGKRIGKFIGKNKRVRKFGNDLGYIAENAPQMAWQYAGSDKHDNAPLIGGAVRTIKDSMGTGRADNSMGIDSLKEMQHPAIFSNQTRKTINEIIPGLLARIYQELQIIRTGDANVDLQRYDFTKNKFTSDKVLRGEVFGKLISRRDIDSHKEDVGSLLNDLDPTGTKLSPEARKALGEQLLRDNLNQKEGSAKRLTDWNSYNGTAAKHGDELTNFFEEYFKGDDENERKLKFTQKYNKLGRGIGDIREEVQHYLNTGLHDIIRDIGILDPEDDNFDTRKLQGYWNDAETYHPASMTGSGAVNKRMRKGRGGRPLPPPPSFPNGPAPKGPNDPTSGGLVGKLDTSKLESLVKEESVKSEVTQIVEILTRIEKGLEKGINLNLTDQEAAPGSAADRKRKRFLDWTLSDAVNGGADGLKWGFDKGSKLAGKVWGGALDNANKLRKGAGELFGKGKNWAKGKIDDLSDVWIEANGKVKPLLQAYKLKAGLYKDEATGQILKKWSEAQGAIRDIETGELITVEQMKDAFSKTKYGKALFEKLGDLKDWTGKQLGRGITMAGSFYGGMWALAKKGYDLLDQPCDVYTPSSKDPVMVAITMKGGGYFSKNNGHAITKPSLIDGPVVNEKKEEVLTEQMLKDGIYDQHGVALKTGWRKLLVYGVAGAKKAWGKLKDLGNWAKDKVSGMYNGVSDFFGGALGKLVGPDGLIIAGGSKIHDVLIDIYNLLDARLEGVATGLHAGGGSSGGKGEGIASGAAALKASVKKKLKKVIGDQDGDGVRDGSLKDQALKAKEAAAEKLKGWGDKGREKGEGLWGRGAGGLAALLDKWRKKEKGDEEEGGGDTNIDLGGGGGDAEPANTETKEERKKRKRNEARARRRDPRYRGWKGKLRNGARLGGNAAGSLARGAGMLGRGALLGSALLGEGALATAGALGSGALTVGSAALSGAATLAGGLFSAAGTIAGAAAGFLSAPVILGALAVGAIGVGAYYGYKYLTKKRLAPLNTVRYAQYGFIAADEEHLQAVMGLEDQVFKGVKFTDGVATLSMDGLNVKNMAEAFGVDLKDKNAVNTWFLWFRDRFKPVYLTNLTAAYKTNSKVKLNDVDSDLTPTEKQTFLNLAKYPEGPYEIRYHPFDYKLKLAAGSAEVKTAVDMATASVARELADKPASAADKLAQAAVLGKGAASMGELKAAETTRLQKDGEEKLAADQRKKFSAQNRLLMGGGGMDLAIKGAALPKSRIASGRIDALTCVRYKTYGLKEMELPRVRALDALETEVEKTLDFGGDGIAVWKGDPKALLAAQGGNFGVDGVTNTKAFEWYNWFNYRFLPVFLNYATTIKRNTNRNKPSQGLEALKPTQEVDVATAIYTTNSAWDSRMQSVWQVTKTPWPDYQLNTDVKSIDDNMKALKDAAKNAILGETRGKIDAATLAKPENAALASVVNRFAEKKGVDFSKNPSMLLSTVEKGKGMDYTRFSGGMQGAKGGGYSMIPGGASSYAGGMAAVHPGKGTGGDINSMPTGSGKGWKNMGPIILAAAKMVGFDPNLMASIAAAESAFDPDAGAGTSSAKGLYQFLTVDSSRGDSTWTAMKKKYGAKWGIAPDAPATDPRANALLGAEFMKENLAGLQSSLGRPVTDTDIYMAHFLGLGGARTFLKADPNTNAAELMPGPANSNKPIFYKDKAGTVARTTGEIYQHFNTLIKARRAQFGIGDLSGAAGSPETAAPATPAATPTGMPSVPTLLAPMGPNGGAAPKTPMGMPDFTGKGPTVEEAKARDANLVATPESLDRVAKLRAETEAAMNEPDVKAPSSMPVTTSNPLKMPVAEAAAAPVAQTLVTAAAAPRAPASMPSGIDPETAQSTLTFSPRARSLNAQQEDQTAKAITGVGGAVERGNTIAQQQLDVLKELLTEFRESRKPAQQSAGAPQARPRNVGDTPVGPISMRKPQ